MESTTKIVSLDGVPARVWEGTTDQGVSVHVFVTRLSVPDDQDASQFEAELEQHRAPSSGVAALPWRLIL